MALRLAGSDVPSDHGAAVPSEQGAAAPRPPFMRSAAYHMLVAELRRYVRGEVNGRAFLISGHRGAGKTTLVTQAVADLELALIRELGTFLAWSSASLRSDDPPQRPLLVKLHGPSLLTAELPRPGGGERRTGAATPGPEAPLEASTPAGKGEGGDEAGPQAATVSTGIAHGALVQITIALYRALAHELADAYAAHARAQYADRPDEQHEAAAQFRLDLDRIPDAALLRDHWEAVAAVRSGIVWEPAIAGRLAGADLPDQGVREIVAAATAAQAFQVCSGAVTYKQTRKNMASYERLLESKAGLDGKELLNKVIGLGVGGLLGLGAAAGTGLPAAAGAGVGLLGALALNASVKRQARRQLDDDYTFIVDRSVQTLERDLPLVIERVRRAGLAPVFLVDELDKLPRAGEPGAEANGAASTAAGGVGEIVRRLKHLTTDYGFFCFLTGLDYFDQVQRRIEDAPYPEEHTYFSDRLLVLHEPSDFTAFLCQAIVSDAQPGPDRELDDLARQVLAKAIIHDTRCSTIDVVRRLARDWSASGTYKVPSGTIAAQPRYQLVVGLQLAIEHVLGDEDLAARFEHGSSLRQSANDALYLVSRRWEAGVTIVDLSYGELARHLLRRSGVDAEGMDDAVAQQHLERRIGRPNALVLAGAVARLAGFLCDFGFLRTVLARRGAGADKLALANFALKVSRGALLRQRSASSDTFEFLYDYEGNDDERRTAGLGRELQASGLPEIVDRATTLEGSARQLGLDLKDLASVGLLPSGSSSAEVVRVSARLLAALRTGALYHGLSADAQVLEGLLAALEATEDPIRWAVGIAAQVTADAGSAAKPAAEVLRLMGRHLAFADLAHVRSVADVAAAIDGYPGSAAGEPPFLEGRFGFEQAWSDWLLALSADGTDGPDLAERAAGAWQRWAGRVADFLDGRPALGLRTHYDDLVLAAADLAPSRVVQRDLGDMTPSDWSGLALDGSLGLLEPSAAPLWALVAGLRALGFGRQFLAVLLDSVDAQAALRRSALDFELARRLAKQAPLAGPGTLIVLRDGTGPKTSGTTGPFLLLRASQMSRYGAGVDALHRLNAFRNRIDER